MNHKVKVIAPDDGTVAVSEAGLTKLVSRSIDKPITSSGSGSWGPFVASYSVNLDVSGGQVQMPDLGAGNQIVRLTGVVVKGMVEGSIGLDLAQILPHVCVPPFRLCIPSPWGDICTPQVCISWPTISVPIPIPIPPLGLSADFGVSAKQQGDNWQVYLNIFPFSLYIDLTPTVDLILNTMKAVVHDTLGAIPLIGDLIEGLVDLVLNALKGILDALLGAIKNLIRALILLIDLFSPTIPFPLTKVQSKQVILQAGTSGDREVSLSISSLTPSIEDHELVVRADFA